MKTLMIFAMVSAFSLFTAAAASACDGMKNPEASAGSQTKNDAAKANASKDKAGGAKTRTGDGANKS